MAGWQSGHAADCNSVYAGSIPTSASILLSPSGEIGRHRGFKIPRPQGVPVRVWPRAPFSTTENGANKEPSDKLVFLCLKFNDIYKIPIKNTHCRMLYLIRHVAQLFITNLLTRIL